MSAKLMNFNLFDSFKRSRNNHSLAVFINLIKKSKYFAFFLGDCGTKFAMGSDDSCEFENLGNKKYSKCADCDEDPCNASMELTNKLMMTVFAIGSVIFTANFL